jgi:2-oxoglutarate dehydrogenase E2 component (dihydrolipoamide succinyltransferase)
MQIDIIVPSPGESITEVQIASWLVSDGDHVEKDQDVVEIDSDKATLSVAASEGGKIQIMAQDGDTVEVGSVIARIDSDAKGNVSAKKEAPKEAAPKQEAEDVAPVVSKEAAVEVTDNKAEAAALLMSPLARKLAKEENLSEAGLMEIIKHHRFNKKDVSFYANKKAELGKTVTSSPKVSSWSGSRDTNRTNMSMLRKKLAQRLVSVKNETAMLTTFNEVNMTPIMAIRKQYKEIFKEKHGVGLGFMSFFTKAVTEAMIYFPQINSQIDGDDVVSHDYVDISIAVSAPKGLVVPVIRNAEKLSLAEIENSIKMLATKARENKISLEEMTGGNFTITNGGVFGSMMSTPILNPPQSAILGMHNIVERPIAVNGKVEIHPMMYIALSYDHRVIDGRESVGFLVKVKEMLENPERMLFGAKPPIETLLDL